jgi:cytochrome b561
MIKNNTTKYGLIAKIFHWTTFLFLIVQIPFGFYLSGLEFSMEKADFENYHSLSGVLIFYVILARLIWKLLNPSPKSFDKNKLRRTIAKTNYFLMYFFIIIIAVSGILKKFYMEESVNLIFFNIQSSKAIFEFSTFFYKLHELSNIVLITLVSLHITATLYHHIFLKQKILKKMLY